jgi:hypothetical protein
LDESAPALSIGDYLFQRLCKTSRIEVRGGEVRTIAPGNLGGNRHSLNPESRFAL